MTKNNKKVRREDWYLIDTEKWCVRAEDMFREGATVMPALMFINKKTGELKFFGRKMAEKIGLDNLNL